MSDKSTTQVLLGRLFETNGFAVRRNEKDDAFWYTSGIPGPFYTNTENLAGEKEASLVLDQINKLLKRNDSRELQAKALFEIINETVTKDPAYACSLDVIAEYYLAQQVLRPEMISGGERRDWFFSIPIAQRLNLPHVMLYKSGDYIITDSDGNALSLNLDNQKVLHVADIINQGSSYTDRWIPMLRKAGADFTETLSVAVRDQAGTNRIKQQQVNVLSPLIVNVELFDEAYSLGLINSFAHREIRQFYDSPREWTRAFLSEENILEKNKSLAGSVRTDREAMFKENDPYQLKRELPYYFSKK
ncbi:phosphoribosyltransferase [Paenibacillus sp. HB172176]|uniref:phosphoribosyltransferase n=1 Tax=Paenibacillus sp. HB172176 TaxID=2493690 RepID=UPI00143B152F|nr:phosphoribosyltransferase [Paenibacillus sp. HB172176]